MMGDASYGGTAVIWSTLDQFAFSTAYSKTGFVGGELWNVRNFSGTAAYLNGNWLAMLGYTEVLPDVTGGVWGMSSNVLSLFMNGEEGWQRSYSMSSILFYMPPPFAVGERMMLSPQLFFIGAPYSYTSITGLVVNTNVNYMVGTGFSYMFTRRFGLQGAYRAMIASETPILNFLMIGTSVTF